MASILESTSLLQNPQHRKAVDDGNSNTNLKRSQVVATNTDKPAKSVPQRYRHVAAVHARARTSLLSSDHEESTSFVGFRNLMVIVLSKYRPCGCRQVFSRLTLWLTPGTVVMNLRLVVENFMKVQSHQVVPGPL